ncbi:MAG TPA: CocE/NonD family hydrolase, partial [Thermoleophilaceae bacterium]
MRGLVALLVAVVLCALLGAASADARLVARGSAEQVQVTGVKHRVHVLLFNKSGHRVQSRRADSLGGLVFRNVKPGPGYRVRSGSSKSARLTVMSDRSAPPSTKFYGQKIPSNGYGYLTTRDGTKLAIDVHLPSGKGPFPTLIEYSGYGYANPVTAESSIEQIATLLGFAVVDVNMRGTGCSGGAFDYFERLQGLDGYDVIETVAHQPWALHHKVGMMGVSYGGISQLFVAETRPPDLAAIAPLSVIDNTASTIYPGGLLNTGFALQWAKDRVHDAEPASATGGQAWALKQIKAGDKTCKTNQVLHGDAVNLVSKTYANSFYVPKVADPLSPITFVHKINVPTFMACQWNDEQTGGHCPDLAEHFT